MECRARLHPARIIGPLREVLTRENLPPPDTRRSGSSRKAYCSAVESGLLTIEEAMKRYRLSLRILLAARDGSRRGVGLAVRAAAKRPPSAFDTGALVSRRSRPRGAPYLPPKQERRACD